MFEAGWRSVHQLTCRARRICFLSITYDSAFSCHCNKLYITLFWPERDGRSSCNLDGGVRKPQLLSRKKRAAEGAHRSEMEGFVLACTRPTRRLCLIETSGVLAPAQPADELTPLLRLRQQQQTDLES